MANTIGKKIEIGLTIRKFKNEDGGRSDPLNRVEGVVSKFRVYEMNKYDFLTIREALEKLNKLIQE